MAGFSSALGQAKTRILFVFDASNSMNGYWERNRKIDVATKLLSETLDELGSGANFELALRVYGHQTKHIPGKQDCDDTELVVPFSKANNLIIKQSLTRIVPQGTTPIARSLEKAAGDFPDEPGARNIIILITDGIEACDEDPCAVSRALQQKGIILKPFIIGIGIDDKYKQTFQCVGNYFDAGNEEGFRSILGVVVTQALNNTTAQISLLNHEGEPIETNAPIILYDSKSGVVTDRIVHTLNFAGKPDTLSLDPLITYKISVETTPPVIADNIKLRPGEHNIIEISCPQGLLQPSFDGGKGDYCDLKCLVYKAGTFERIAIQNFGENRRYLAGTYDVEILTTPPTRIENVEIGPGETAGLRIPMPGNLLLQVGANGYGGIFERKGNEERLVIPFNDRDAAGRYTLQPGKYVVVYRSRNAKQTLYTLRREFEIRSGVNTNLSLQ
jgi:Ca-activated chloride channel family protein